MTDFRIPLTVGATAAALCLAVPAVAQSNDGATAAPDGSMQMQRADQVTCAHLSAMDANAMETTLYYIAGYKRGQDDAMNLSGSGGMETSSATTGMSGNATGASGTGAMTGSDTADTTTAMNQTGGGTGTDLTGTEVPDSATGTTAVGETASATGASGGATDGSDIDGFFAIPVAQVTVTCLDDPSRSVTDVIDEQRGAANN